MREDERHDPPRSARGEELASGEGSHEVARFPVIEEELELEKRVVRTGRVRVVKHVEEVEQEVEIDLASEHVAIENVEIGRFVDEPQLQRREGEVWIVPVTEEVLVVEKRLWLARELRITTERGERIDRRRVVLRKEVVDVRRDGEPIGAEPGADAPRPRPDREPEEPKH
jgi:stress response protein YsnF